MSKKKDKKMMEKVKGSEAKIYFDPKVLPPDSANMRATVNALLFAGRCSGAILDRLLQGEVRLYFNPVVHTTADQSACIDEVKRTLMEKDYVFRWSFQPEPEAASGAPFDEDEPEAAAAQGALGDASEADEEASS